MIAALLTLALAGPHEDSGIGLSLAEVATLVQRHVPDRIVAGTIRGSELRRCLTWVDIAQLASQGMGPRGLEAARQHQCEEPVPLASAPPTPPDGPPSRQTRRKKRRAERRRRR